MPHDEYRRRCLKLYEAFHNGIIDEKELSVAQEVLDLSWNLDNEIAFLLKRGY